MAVCLPGRPACRTEGDQPTQRWRASSRRPEGTVLLRPRPLRGGCLPGRVRLELGTGSLASSSLMQSEPYPERVLEYHARRTIDYGHGRDNRDARNHGIMLQQIDKPRCLKPLRNKTVPEVEESGISDKNNLHVEADLLPSTLERRFAPRRPAARKTRHLQGQPRLATGDE
jgi:hypothetical protein